MAGRGPSSHFLAGSDVLAICAPAFIPRTIGALPVICALH